MMASFYYDQSQRILDDGGLLFPRGPVDRGDVTMLTHPPGYSILMATIADWLEEADGEPDPSRANTGLRVVQIVGDAFSCVVVFLIAAELFPIAAALIAGVFSSFSPHFAYYSIMLSPDSLSVLPILLAIYFVIRASKRPRLLTMVAAGALVGLSCWLRSNALLLSLFLAAIIPFLFEPGKRLRYSLALIGGTVVLIAPITIRNWIVFDRFIPLSVMAGLNLVEGIADYDKENKFGMPPSDYEAALKDAEWHGRPEYAANLWKPDGLEREQARLAHGLAVVRSNPAWFLGVMLRRMEFMLRYNDFRQQELANVTMAPTIAVSPSFGHKLEIADPMAPVWTKSSLELIANGTVVSERAAAALKDNQLLRVISDSSGSGDLFFSEPIAVKKNNDYVLRLAVRLEEGRADVKIGTSDPRVALALVSTSKAEKKQKQEKDPDFSGSTFAPRMRVLHVPFASGEDTQVKLSLYKSTSERTVVSIADANMFEAGPTPFLWTRYPRAFIQGIQKNLYKTNLMRALIAIGIILLSLARRGGALAVLLIVPGYFLCAQSPLHTEYRYVLAIHYLLIVISAVTIYCASAAIRQGFAYIGLTSYRRPTPR